MNSTERLLKEHSLGIFIAAEVLFIYILIAGLGQFLYPVIIACILLYISLPAIDFLEKYFRLPRQFAVSIIFILQLYFIAILLTQWLPSLISETQKLLLALPKYIKNIINYFNTIALDYEADFQIESAAIEKQIADFFTDLTNLNLGTIEHTLSFAQDTASHLLGHLIWVIDLVLIPLLYLFLGMNYKTIIAGIEHNTPLFLKEEVHLLINKTNQVFSAYIRGQIILVCTLAAGYSTGFMLIGLPYGFALGIITGLLSFVPYLGTTIGLVTSLLILFTLNSNILAYLSLLSVFAVVHGLEYSVLIPSLVGQHVGLSFFTSFLALLIGANNFGVVGAVFAMPVTAIGKHIFERMRLYCTESNCV